MLSPLKIFKFGGVSLENADAIRNVGQIIKTYHSHNKLLVVVSAMGKITNKLEDLHRAHFESKPYRKIFEEIQNYHLFRAKKLLENNANDLIIQLENVFAEMEWLLEDEPSPSYDFSYDQMIIFGEILSSKIVAAYFNSTDIPTTWIDSRSYIQTDNTYRNAYINWELTEKLVGKGIRPALENRVVLAQGFIGGTSENYSTTLGREGSDFTAAIYAKCLKAQDVTIWKDVAGIMNADPKEFKNATLYPQLSYHQMIEMSYYGAKVIHPKTIKPLVNCNIPLYVKCFTDIEQEGTVIDSLENDIIEPTIIFKRKQCLLSFAVLDYSFVSEKNLSKIFDTASKHGIRFNLMQNSAISFSVCIDNSKRKVKAFIKDLKPEFSVRYNEKLELITIMYYNPVAIEKIIGNQEILLLQKTRNTYQAVVHAKS